jgi:HSP20 family molecular chaperone IbpA
MFLSLLDLMRQAGQLLPSATAVSPAFELHDGGDTLRLRAVLPGIDPKSVQIQVSETSLAIGGHATLEERTEGPDFYRMQAAVRQVYRELALPARVDPHRSTAQWETDDVLVLHLPKR